MKNTTKLALVLVFLVLIVLLGVLLRPTTQTPQTFAPEPTICPTCTTPKENR